MEVVSSSSSNEGPAEIVFYDLETTVPNRAGQRFWILEFGAMVVCPRKLVELESYSTLIRPGDLSVVALRSGRCDGITREAVANAPTFEEIADKIFSILNGHNIQRFDCVRIKEAFSEIGRPASVPVGMIDSLGVLTEKFGRRAGNMKMATLADYFGLSKSTGHQALCNCAVLGNGKHLLKAAFILNESSLPSVLNGNWQSPSTMVTRSRSNGKLPYREETSRKLPPTSLGYQRTTTVPYVRGSPGKMTERMKNLLCKANEKSVANLLKHLAHSLLR